MGTARLAALTFALLGSTVLVRQAAAAPQPPALVVSQGLSDSTIEVMWTAVSGASSYKVYRGGVLLTSTPGTYYDDSSLSPSTSASYTIAAVVSGIQSPASATSTASTQARTDTTPPTQPGVIAVSALTASSAQLRWSASTDSVRVIGYRILRGPVGAPLNQLVDIATSDSGNSYKAANLRSATAYQFAVAALDPAGNVSPYQIVTFTTLPSSDAVPPQPPANTSLAVRAFSSTRIDVQWGASPSSDISGYEIQRDGVVVARVDLPLRFYYSDNGLSPLSSHTYAVRAVDWARNVSAFTAAKSATTTAPGAVSIRRGPYASWITASSARVAWWTNVPSASVVRYGVGTLSQQVSDPVLRQEHVMLLGPLNGAAKYSYSVGDGATMSPTATFTTAPNDGAPYTFTVIGDYGGNSPGETQNASLIAGEGTQFILTLGDNVTPEGQDPDFTTTFSDYDGRFFKQFSTPLARECFWGAIGNVDLYGGTAFFRMFWLPNNERWYSYNWGDAHILVLNGEDAYSAGSAQYAFAQADLRANQSKRWRIVVEHDPPYSSASTNSSALGIRSDLLPMLQQEHVQLFLSGNTHNYERTYPLLNGSQAAGGIVYIVSGLGGTGNNPFTLPAPAWSAFREDAYYEHLRISVSPTALRVDGIRADTGAIFDSVSISP